MMNDKDTRIFKSLEEIVEEYLPNNRFGDSQICPCCGHPYIPETWKITEVKADEK